MNLDDRQQQFKEDIQKPSSESARRKLPNELSAFRTAPRVLEGGLSAWRCQPRTTSHARMRRASFSPA